MIAVTDDISIDDAELSVTFIRASGPGGQNVNKVSSAVQLRFDARRSASLNDAVSARLQKLAGSRLTLDGEIVITASRFRSQDRNRADAVERLVGLIRKAAVAPVKRRRTRPPRAVTERRLAAKARRGATKSLRAKPEGRD
ncbi:MAG TPA: alternative ribosome rescue aminoacyl-tRNA hydrolase ArfB [Caulobacteraceae bacterium]